MSFGIKVLRTHAEIGRGWRRRTHGRILGSAAHRACSALSTADSFVLQANQRNCRACVLLGLRARTPRDRTPTNRPMRFHADLHVHSKYSRATSRDLDLEHLAAWACR